jgi:glyoxylase I family protein
MCFFGLADGSALAFFQFADPSDQAEFGPQMPFSPFHHTALQVDQGDPGRAGGADRGGGI